MTLTVLALAGLVTLWRMHAQHHDHPPLGINVQKKHSPPLAPADRARVDAGARKLNDEGVQLYQQGKLTLALDKMVHALAMREKLFLPMDYPHGHADLAQSLYNVGFLLQSQCEYGKASPFLEKALAMRQQLYPQGHPDLANSLNNMGLLLHARGEDDKALRYHQQALAMRQQLYPNARYPQGHADLAASLNNVGLLLHARGEDGKALPYYEKALAMQQQVYSQEHYPQGHRDLAVSLNNLGLLLQAQGEYGKALPYYERALAMRQKLYSNARDTQGLADLAVSLNNLGYLLQTQGEYGKALSYYEKALAMQQQLYPKASFPQGHPDLAVGLNNLGFLLQEQGEYGKALPYSEQALAMRQQLYPKEHPDLAGSLNNLGLLLQTQGEYDKALTYHEQALAMRQQLYPKARYPQGHPDLAVSLNNLGLFLQTQGEYNKALACYEKALAMRQQLYPKARYPQGHSDLAVSLNNLGYLMQTQGEYGKALSYYEKALAMQQQVYTRERFPHGHFDLAVSLNNLGYLMQTQREYGKALPYHEQALAMRQQLYPKALYPQGHPDLAVSLNNMGLLLLAQGKYDMALPYHEFALAIDRGLGDRLLSGAPEAEALAYLRSQPLTRDYYLSVTAQANTPAFVSYAQVWPVQAQLSRLLHRRHQATRIALAGSEEARHKWQDLLDARGHLAHLLLSPGKDAAARDHELAQLTDRKEGLERELTGLLPELERARELDHLGPKDLAGFLRKGAAFVDVLRYTHIGKGQARTTRYVAFVVRPERTVRRVELHDSEPIESALQKWQEGIVQFKETSAEAAAVARLVWEPLARELPVGTTTVYLAPDGELAFLPWAALPGSKPGTVLLEDLTIALVPHGRFLLEQLKYPTHVAAGKETVLALGDVDYGPARQDGYKPLPGTAAEVRQVFAVSGTRAKKELTKERATWEALKESLPKARYAHLATHGFFNLDALLQEQKRVERQLKTWELLADRPTQRLGLGLRSPLSYTGLVLAGANLPAQARVGGIATGEALVDLPLENLRLCVLSACESGLGDLGPVAGEGVQGLPRAFHLAGCPNVISSLWNVNDKATAALMARFYHELWVSGKTPLEALRAAQLTILLHPERIDDLADRSRPNFTNVIAMPADQHTTPGAAASKRTPTKLWAAFVLSGVGQ